jgi:tetratricopeptide (TPR) repeat protein
VPGEPRLALYLGSIYENLASPAIQAALEQLEVSALGPRPALLSRAEYQFRSALLLEPDFPVVSLRLGRTLQLKSRNTEALPFLMRAEQGVGLPEQQYCAALFSGLAYQSLERDDEARAAFQRAATLFPDAQTPKLVMAQMALRTSGQDDALVFLRAMNSGGAAGRNTDPWWVYDIAVAPAAADRIEILLTSVREALR